MSDNLSPLYPDDTVIAHGVWHGTPDLRLNHGPQQFLWTYTVVGPGDRLVVSDGTNTGIPWGVVRG